MRAALRWDDCYQFYSLKDTGIRDLANAAGVVVARDQARHSDITTTNKYIQKHGVQEVTLGFEGNLSYGDNEKDDYVLILPTTKKTSTFRAKSPYRWMSFLVYGYIA